MCDSTTKHHRIIKRASEKKDEEQTKRTIDQNRVFQRYLPFTACFSYTADHRRAIVSNSSARKFRKDFMHQHAVVNNRRRQRLRHMRTRPNYKTDATIQPAPGHHAKLCIYRQVPSSILPSLIPRLAVHRLGLSHVLLPITW